MDRSYFCVHCFTFPSYPQPPRRWPVNQVHYYINNKDNKGAIGTTTNCPRKWSLVGWLGGCSHQWLVGWLVGSKRLVWVFVGVVGGNFPFLSHKQHDESNQPQQPQQWNERGVSERIESIGRPVNQPTFSTLTLSFAGVVPRRFVMFDRLTEWLGVDLQAVPT